VRYVFFVRDRDSTFAISIWQCKETNKISPSGQTPDSNNSTSTPSADGVASAATSRGASTAATNDSPRSIALQSSPQSRPFGIHPAADEHDRRNDGDQHDTEQNRIFDERGAFLVILELLDKLRHLTHVSLQFVFDAQRTGRAQRRDQPKSSGALCVAASPQGLAAEATLAVGYAIVIVVVVIAAARSH
jgi:hypothetical protein